jgi:hypothetical protein
MARQKITIQPAPEAELANITYWYQETGLPPVGDTDAGIVNATFRDAHRSGLLGSALGRGVARATVMPLHPRPHETILTRSCASSSRLDGHTIWMLVVRRAASSTGSMRDCSPITNPLRPKLGAFSWTIEIVHHSVDTKLLQHSAITPSLTYGELIGAVRNISIMSPPSNLRTIFDGY